MTEENLFSIHTHLLNFFLKQKPGQNVRPSVSKKIIAHHHNIRYTHHVTHIMATRRQPPGTDYAGASSKMYMQEPGPPKATQEDMYVLHHDISDPAPLNFYGRANGQNLAMEEYHNYGAHARNLSELMLVPESHALVDMPADITLDATYFEPMPRSTDAGELKPDAQAGLGRVFGFDDGTSYSW